MASADEPKTALPPQAAGLFTATGKIESGVKEVVALVFALLNAAGAYLVWWPAWRSLVPRSARCVPRHRADPLSYLFVCSFLFAAFYPLLEVNIFAPLPTEAIAKVLHELSVNFSVTDVFLRAGVIFLPIVGLSKLFSLLVRKNPRIRARIESTYCYVFGTQLLIIPMVIAVQWAVPWNFIARGGVPLLWVLASVFIFHPFPVLLTEFVRLVRRARLGVPWPVACCVVLLSAATTPLLCMECKSLAERVAESGETAPPKTMTIGECTARAVGAEIELDVTLYPWNGSPYPLYLRDSALLMVPGPGDDPVRAVYSESAAPALVVEWSGPVGPLLMVEPKNGGWMHLRARVSGEAAKPIFAQVQNTKEPVIRISLKSSELPVFRGQPVTFRVLRAP